MSQPKQAPGFSRGEHVTDELAKQFSDLAAKYGPTVADAALIPQLDPTDHHILRCLSERRGWTAGDVARHMGSPHVRREAQLLTN